MRLQKIAGHKEEWLYQLIHHEFATIAGFENPNSGESDYEISNQITSYLSDTIVKRLSIRSTSQSGVPCSTLDLSKPVPIGLKCISSTQKVYERVNREGFGEAWKDSNGLIWSERLEFGNHYYAIKLCRELDASLPSRSEFLYNFRSKFFEVLQNTNEIFWTSEVKTPGSQYAYVFNSYIDYYNVQFVSNRHRDDHSISIRCVSR